MNLALDPKMSTLQIEQKIRQLPAYLMPEVMNYVEYLLSKLTPHPLATFTSELKLNSPVGNGLPASYISCTDPVYDPTAVCRQRAKAAGWPIVELATGHDAMITAPLATADLLERLSIDLVET